MRGTARVFVLDPLKRIKQIPSILTAKSQKNYSISNFFFFFFTLLVMPGFSKSYQMFQNFPQPPHVGVPVKCFTPIF